MADEPIKYEDLPAEHKKKYDELKAICEAELIGSFEKTRSHGIRFKGFTQGVLDGLDLSLLTEERTRALRQEINYVVAHSLHRHSESPVNTLERVALHVVQEIMKHQYSPSGPVLGTHQGEMQLHTRPPLPYAMAAPQQQGSPAYVVYKVGGDPGDYQFLYEPPKEIPHGYVRQRRGETVSEYIQRFRTVKNRCYSVHLSEKEAIELAVAGLQPLKDLTVQVEYNSLAHMVQRLTAQPEFSFDVNMAGLVNRHGKDKAESSHSHGKDKEEADPHDRPHDDDRRYLTEEEVRSVRYQRPLSSHLLNKYEQQYDRRRRYDDDERYRRSDVEDRRYRQHDRNNNGYELHARGRSREQDNMDRHWDCPFFKHCWDSGMSRLPTIENCPECRQRRKGTNKVSVFERLGPLPPQNKRAESSQEEDFEESDGEEDRCHRPRWCPMDSAMLEA
ncbi:hypothetical protein QYE76_040023 [Lolium multiflorum]|uniref:Uncharacterized protein n=1 Tax=Lolium multiflorum TaxID=4521 RepID=A0AAD8TAH5_LOLMU|nr:hypothetical protein QYE76_040023 [Lolium multiflorum]